MPTKQEIAAALGILRAVADTVRELGSAPRGPLLAALGSKGVNFQQFQQIENILVNSGLCQRSAELLIWTGPKQFAAHPGELAADDGLAELSAAVESARQASAPHNPLAL